jgi:flavodoxin
MGKADLKAAVLFWSGGGNTRKVAAALHHTLKAEGIASELLEMGPDLDVDYADYDIVLVGAPSYQWLPPDEAMDFLKRLHRRKVTVVPAAPEQSGRFGVVFCTFGGPDTGYREAIPCLKYMGQFLEHAGLRVVDEWAVVGQFHDPGRAQLNVCGRLGDIRGRPDEHDLKDVSERLRGLLRQLQHKLRRPDPGDHD